MTDKEFRKLKRQDLLEIMLAQSQEIDSLQAELKETRKKLEEKAIAIDQAGNIAEASLAVTELFAVAQRAADIYMASVRSLYPLTEGGDEDEK